jgi:hypothetical protein
MLSAALGTEKQAPSKDLLRSAESLCPGHTSFLLRHECAPAQAGFLAYSSFGDILHG